MMEVQKYLQKHGLDKLKEEFAIGVTDYPDRVVLNYNQIESPRFNSIVDECRGLILHKGCWDVMARSFDRFYNWGEGVGDPERKSNPLNQRVASIGDPKFVPFPFQETIIQEKLDGSLISVYADHNGWQAATRKMAFAEGPTNLGRTFSEVFWAIANKFNLKERLLHFKNYTIVFELTGPENRVVTPYSEPNITLIGGRYNKDSMRELTPIELDNMSIAWGIDRPKPYKIPDKPSVEEKVEELLNMVDDFPSMDEGVVILHQLINGSYWRIKVKNPRFVAIAHMRNNGNISPKRILFLIMENEHHEYLKYFDTDKPYFDFIEGEYKESIARLELIYNETMSIEDQKEFALTIMPKTLYSFENGVLFSVRKNKTSIAEELSKIEAKRIDLSMNLKARFVKKFGVKIEDE